jgi:phosphoglycolate phosphatase
MGRLTSLDTLLFDLDGTLADPAEGFTQCVAHALEVVGLPPVPREHLEACIGPPLQDSFLALGAEPEQVGRLVDAYRDRYRGSGIFENSLYSGIKEVLDSLSAQGHVLHLATSKPKVFAEIILEHFEIRPFFTHVFGSNLDGSLSDKRDLLQHAHEQAGFDVGRSAMVGDRRFDMEAARDLGLFAVGACWGYGSREELEAAGAQVLIDRPTELGSALDRVDSG